MISQKALELKNFAQNVLSLWRLRRPPNPCLSFDSHIMKGNLRSWWRLLLKRFFSICNFLRCSYVYQTLTRHCPCFSWTNYAYSSGKFKEHAHVDFLISVIWLNLLFNLFSLKCIPVVLYYWRRTPVNEKMLFWTSSSSFRKRQRLFSSHYCS